MQHFGKYNTLQALQNAITNHSLISPYVAKVTGQTGLIYSVDNDVITTPADPVFSISNNYVSITCSTSGAEIYYKVADDSVWTLYSSPILISQNTTFIAYSSKTLETSNQVTYNAVYVAPVVTVENPVFSISDNYVSITCATGGATIYYKEESDYQWSVYSNPIAISQDTTFIAYADKDNHYSEQVTYLAIYEEPDTPIVDYSTQHLTFNISSSGLIKTDNYNENQYSYQKNNGSWEYITGDISVVAGDVVKIKGNCVQYKHITFENCTCGFTLSGNIMSIYNENFVGLTQLTISNCLDHLFEGCTGLTSAENLILPATTLVNYCYASMFKGCTSLTTAPELPALSLSSEGVYSSMFEGCTSLTYIKCLATSFDARYETSSWTRYVSASGTFVKNSSMSNWTTGIDGIPSGWTIQNAA